ncbi:endolytic transglycosylase MltG, partial [Acidobacteria bacterium ACD]|nr:endolytic transglycosylase MltG [Acidobacteria bacterium ACD]
MGEEAAYHALFERPDALPGVPAGAPTLEGFLFPSTYDFTRPLAERDVAARLVREFRRRLPPGYEEAARRRGLSLLEAVTLASIVEKETGVAEERPRIASVFHNRLKKRMRLQSDPTIIYGIFGGSGMRDHPITQEELERPNPYNTYKIDGLPPTPIGNPGRASIEAVLKPAKTKDLYFVADGTGGHIFAASLAEHNSNVVKWRKIEREIRARQKAEAEAAARAR